MSFAFGMEKQFLAVPLFRLGLEISYLSKYGQAVEQMKTDLIVSNKIIDYEANGVQWSLLPILNFGGNFKNHQLFFRYGAGKVIRNLSAIAISTTDQRSPSSIFCESQDLRTGICSEPHNAILSGLGYNYFFTSNLSGSAEVRSVSIDDDRKAKATALLLQSRYYF